MTVQCWSMVRLAAVQIGVAGQPLAPVSWGGLTVLLIAFNPKACSVLWQIWTDLLGNKLETCAAWAGWQV